MYILHWRIYIYILAPLKDVHLVGFMSLACQVRVTVSDSGLCCCLCDVFLINSLGCGFCRSALGLVLFPIVMMTMLLNGRHGWRERHHSVQCQLDVVAAWPDPNIFKCFVQNKKGFFFSSVKSRKQQKPVTHITRNLNLTFQMLETKPHNKTVRTIADNCFPFHFLTV